MTQIEFEKLYNEYKPIQSINEMWLMIKVLQENKVAKILEIGTKRGGSSYIWSKVAEENNGYYIGVDVRYDNFMQYMNEFKCPTYFFLENSRSNKLKKRIKKIIKEDKLDFVFVDGDHREREAKRDILEYSKFLKPGGIIGVHDYNKQSVKSAVESIIDKNEFEYDEFRLIPGKHGTFYFILKD